MLCVFGCGHKVTVRRTFRPDCGDYLYWYRCPECGEYNEFERDDAILGTEVAMDSYSDADPGL